MGWLQCKPCRMPCERRACPARIHLLDLLTPARGGFRPPVWQPAGAFLLVIWILGVGQLSCGATMVLLMGPGLPVYPYLTWWMSRPIFAG